MASPGLILAIGAGLGLYGTARNQQMKAKSEATTEIRNTNQQIKNQIQDSRNKNQKIDENSLLRKRQMDIFNLQRSSGVKSTFLSPSSQTKLGG